MEKRNYFSNWKCWGDLVDSFTGWGVDRNADICGDEPELIFAAYGDGDYCGDAVVVFKRDGKWQLVTGGHCSCYGLEDQWEPEDFDPAVHLEAVKQGRRIAAFEEYYDYPKGLNADFDAWLAWAVTQ